MEELETKSAEVQSRLIVNACAAISNDGVKHYIRIHYSAIARLIDSFRATGEHPAEIDSTPKKLILQHLQTHCMEIWTFLISTFSSYLSDWTFSPDKIAATELTNITTQIKQLDFNGPDALSISLQEICMESILQKDQPWYLSTSAKWLALIETLKKMNTLTPGHSEDTILVFIRHNYNFPKAYDAICRWVALQLKTMTTPLEQQQYLTHLKSICQQASAFSGKKFFKKHQSLGKSLLNHLKSELKLIGLELSMNQGDTAHYPSAGNFTVSLSVKQLAFFAYLQVESGIILSQTAKQVHQHFASRFSTIEGGAISEKSFKNAYYSHAPADIVKVIDKLSQMLALAEEAY
ncbi:hypothetical protein G6M26_27020 [Agrobacterium tumefaciens]|nr:hypothetical protein [Agrobacterium tumefaciens]NTE22207.1 hypothetical protein [Agrobacterium tumefaciens]